VFEYGSVETIPAGPDEVWDACLDLTWQYDGVVRLSATERLVVFARSSSRITQASGKSKPQFVDVLLAVAIRGNLKGGSEAGICWLDPAKMELRKPERAKAPPAVSSDESDQYRARRECALGLSARFVMELAVQLSWREQLLNKVRSAKTLP
jgi:hypothetical protein